jgi:hypothetical protein
MKKLTLTVKIVIALGVLAVIFFGLSIGAAFASPYRARKAIESIGVVTYTDESKEKIDNAIEYYNDIGKNTLGESALVGTIYTNANKSEELENTLNEAKRAYTNLAIKNAIVSENRKYVEGYSYDDLVEIFAYARSVIDDYFKGSTDFENYEEFANLEKKYAVQSDGNEDDSNNSSDEEIELC